MSYFIDTNIHEFGTNDHECKPFLFVSIRFKSVVIRT